MVKIGWEALTSLLACPMCTELLDHGVNAAKAWRFGSGIGWSILLLLAVPFLMVGTLIGVILRSQRRKNPSEMTNGIKN